MKESMLFSMIRDLGALSSASDLQDIIVLRTRHPDFAGSIMFMLA